MLLILSVRFRKHIALLLYSIFYAQFIMAAESRWEKAAGRSYAGYYREAAGYRHALRAVHSDSTIYPLRHPQAPSAWTTAFRSATPAPAHSLAAPASPAIGGPTQPETQSFQSVNANNMVDLFSGDFSYNIPLLDVGGYPVNIAYHSGATMDEDASWVGLGWNINPGTITRNMRGLPDDFDGSGDTVTRVAHIKPNVSVGVTIGGDVEVVGLPQSQFTSDSSLTVGGSLGVFHTTYTGWGMEVGVNASINAGSKAFGFLNSGLSLTNNSQNGITLTPSLSGNLHGTQMTQNGGFAGGLQLSLPYNSRVGIKGIQLGLNDEQTLKTGRALHSSPWSTMISFAAPTYTPTMSMAMTNYNFTFTAKVGTTAYAYHPSVFISAYGGKEYIAATDTSLSLPAFGYLNLQDRGNNWSALTDFNREKEIPYRDNPPVPHIAVPAYTYDVFSISGEGTGGMFRAYRGDIGFIADHLMSSKTTTGAASIDLGFGDAFHGGVDLNANYSNTQTGPWLPENNLMGSIPFQKSNGLYEAAYFRNPGEKTTNTSDFYKAVGNDDVLTASLLQPGGSSGSTITASNILRRYRNKELVGLDTLPTSGIVKASRDKRSEVISYLTAQEASLVGLDKYIYHYGVNQFPVSHCQDFSTTDTGFNGTGLMGYYYSNIDLKGSPDTTRLDTAVYFNWNQGTPFNNSQSGTTIECCDAAFPHNNFSVRWLGKFKAPVTGPYDFGTYSDDGVRVWIGDSLLINDWTYHSLTWDTCRVNMVAGTMYDMRIEYFQGGGRTTCQFAWRRPDRQFDRWDKNDKDTLGIPYLYPPDFTDTALVDTSLVRENRVNDFRKANHISQIDVLNPDGRRYVYGIPVYNLQQKEVSFSVATASGNIQTGLTGYSSTDNSINNTEGKDSYYSRDQIPAYAHSFLLTGILSPDYVDLTGDGISDDDIGDAIKFTYSKTSGIANPFSWRAPYITDSATYNEGFRSYSRDDKGHYISGIKELWYLHTVESKTMVATFTLKPRQDLLEIDENGNKSNGGKAMYLAQIDLYSKADLKANNGIARPIKTVHFDYSYELCRGINQPINDSGKLTLKRIWFTYNGNNKGALNPYVFNYHPNNPNYRVNTADKWGTYKDPLQNPNSTPTNLINNSEYPYAIQDSATAAYNVGAWTLDSIQLPSGGRIKVNYESDDYAYVQNRRATQMCQIAGFGDDASGSYSDDLYSFILSDHLYVYVNVPSGVTSTQDLYARYLAGMSKLYFRMYVKMPTDDFGSGSEYVPAYATPDTTAPNWYGITNSNTIWIKVKGVNTTGDGSGPNSPMAQTAINFLRLNLPDKAYPGSELNDNLNLPDIVTSMAAEFSNIEGLVLGFSNTARVNGWAKQVDLNRSWVRLNSPIFKKLGGGLRVKSILIYDNWNNMTHQKETVYGQTYDYTTTTTVNGVTVPISSGVASWEPAVGAEENPFHLPIEYTVQASMLAPAAAQYTEEPLGETFYPGASVGYSKVRVRTIHEANVRSANGYTETSFYTTYDFPTSWDWSMLDNDTKKRFKPVLGNFLRINARDYLDLSQGFKIELNDMNGKLRKKAVYAENDTSSPVSYGENFYKVDNQSVQFKHLKNTVTAIDPFGNIDTAAIIGKDIEVMSDMRDQTSTSIGANVSINTDMFVAGAWPMILPSLLGLYQRETNQFRSVALVKIVQRYGILDSVVKMDKGSYVSSKNLLYDAETGDPLLVRTQNIFNDSVYQFTYPSHWVYKGMAGAYQNIDATLSHLTVTNGKITAGLTQPDSAYLTSGDELLVYSKQTMDVVNCVDDSSYFPNPYKLWVVDTNAVHGGPQSLFLMDQFGAPFSGHGVTLKVIRSGHRNMNSPIGTVTSMGNPLVADNSGIYHLQYDSTTKVLNAAANEVQQYWKVTDEHRNDIGTNCVFTEQDSANFNTEACSCLKPFFSYLIQSHSMFIPLAFQRTVGSLVAAANAAGAGININACPILANNANLPFYTSSMNPNLPVYTATIGHDVVQIRTISGLPMHLYNMTINSCDSLGRVIFKDPANVMPGPDTVTTKIIPGFTVNLFSNLGTTCPGYIAVPSLVDSTSDHLMVENSLSINGMERSAVSVLRFDHPDRQVPAGATILSAKLVLQADQRGHYPGLYNNANSVLPSDSVGFSISGPGGWFPYQSLDTMFYEAYYSPWYSGVRLTNPFQNDTVDVTNYLNGYINGTYVSSTFILTQGWQNLHSNGPLDSTMIALGAVPPYLASGYGNAYSTWYNQHYTDPSKWPAMVVTYVAPPPFIDTLGAVLQYNGTIACTTVTGRSCYSAVTDTVVNPYQYGLLGDFRPQRGYVYYGRRNESDPSVQVNIRTAGIISNFAPFWTLQGNQWGPVYDSSRWVWNTQTTLYNRKGFEVENKDPLGRYNSGIYGYLLSLPTAVIQNSRYQESAYDGFEDYGYTANICNDPCPETKPFDFSPYIANISTDMAHTGLYSLKLSMDSVITMPVVISAAPPPDQQFATATVPDTCTTTRLSGIRASSNSVLPPFSPFTGKKMLIGGWVKEANSCTCQSYSRDHIQVKFSRPSGDTTITLGPSGNMIEGWQRYESIVMIPGDATAMTLLLEASDSSTTYFDDIRLHPFNAEMKSYVYNPVNLRLMAEMDENNYATFYEYDDDGTLVREKKETERGIVTVKESRNALMQNP